MRPDARVRAIVDEVIAALNDESPAFPSSIATAPSIDRGKLTRLMRLAAAWAGGCQHAEVHGGGGVTTTTIKITGSSGDLMVTLKTDQDNAVVQKFSVDMAL
jgi:hypothetical protein